MATVDTDKLQMGVPDPSTGQLTPTGDLYRLMDHRFGDPNVNSDIGKVPAYVGSHFFEWQKRAIIATGTATAETSGTAAQNGYGRLDIPSSVLQHEGWMQIRYSYTPTQSFHFAFSGESGYSPLRYKGAILTAADAGIICNGDLVTVFCERVSIGNTTGFYFHLVGVDRHDRCDEMLDDGAYYPNAVQDRNGNWYGAVVIGRQVWLAENLKTRNGGNWTSIPVGGTTASESTPYCYYPNSQSYRVDDYGLLYNWAAAMDGGSASSQNPSGVQGLSPNGWHLPSEAEWNQLIKYVSGKRKFRADMSTTNAVAKALSARSGWSTSSNDNAVGNNQSANNKTMFGAKASGTFNHEGFTGNFGNSTIFWTTTQDSSLVKGIYIGNANATVETGAFNKGSGFAIRCVCDLSPEQFRDWYVKTYGSMQHHIEDKSRAYYGWAVYNDTWGEGIMSMLDEKFHWRINECIVSLKFDYDVGDNATLYLDEGDSSYTPVNIYYRDQYITEGIIKDGDTCIFRYTPLSLELLSVDRWGEDILAKQDVLIGSGNGQNIKTVNGNSLPGTGNIELGKGILTGIASSLVYSAAQVTLNQSGADLEHGAFLFIQFGVNMPALARLNVANTVIINSDIIWKNATLPAGVINSGDLCVFYYAYSSGTNMSFLLYNSRWASLKTINGQTLSGVGDVSLAPPHTYHNTTLSTANATATITCAANERAFHSVVIDAANITINIDILNIWDNTILLMGSEYDIKQIIFKSGNTVLPVLYEAEELVGEVSDKLVVMLTKVKYVKLVAEVVNGAAIVDIDHMNSYTPPSGS